MTTERLFAPEPYPFSPWFHQSATLEEANRRLADFAHKQTQFERAEKAAKKIARKSHQRIVR